MSGSDYFKRVLDQNKQWAESTASSNPDLFPALAKGQSPQILWIGCADSRIPETTVCALNPGDVFVHRNIANIVTATDLNAQSVIAYGVAHLKVNHIVVCGHTSCGGVAAALGNEKLGMLDVWLMPLKQLRAAHEGEWESAGLGEKERSLALVEANVRKGVQTLKENAEVIEAMRERGLVVHGLVHDVGCGVLRELEIKEDEHEGKKREKAFWTKK